MYPRLAEVLGCIMRRGRGKGEGNGKGKERERKLKSKGILFYPFFTVFYNYIYSEGMF